MLAHESTCTSRVCCICVCALYRSRSFHFCSDSILFAILYIFCSLRPRPRFHITLYTLTYVHVDCENRMGRKKIYDFVWKLVSHDMKKKTMCELLLSAPACITVKVCCRPVHEHIHVALQCISFNKDSYFSLNRDRKKNSFDFRFCCFAACIKFFQHAVRCRLLPRKARTLSSPSSKVLPSYFLSAFFGRHV